MTARPLPRLFVSVASKGLTARLSVSVDSARAVGGRFRLISVACRLRVCGYKPWNPTRSSSVSADSKGLRTESVEECKVERDALDDTRVLLQRVRNELKNKEMRFALAKKSESSWGQFSE